MAHSNITLLDCPMQGREHGGAAGPVRSTSAGFQQQPPHPQRGPEQTVRDRSCVNRIAAWC